MFVAGATHITRRYSLRSLPLAAFLLFMANPGLAQVVTPYSEANVPLASPASEAAYTVDLTGLPGRPRLVVEAIPDESHPDMQLELEISGCVVETPSNTVQCPGAAFSGPVSGLKKASFNIWLCALQQDGKFTTQGGSCEVKIRATDFGAGGAPATFNLLIRGETDIPTSTLSAQISTTVQSVSIPASKDTTIYEAFTDGSNGQGESIWTRAGSSSDSINGLIDFDLGSSIPTGATILSARIELNVLEAESLPSGAPTFQLFSIPLSTFLPIPWAEGSGDAPGDESSPPALPAAHAATWWYPESDLGLAGSPWWQDGGSRDYPELATTNVTQTGLIVVSSTALRDHIHAIRSNPATHDGFLLVPYGGAIRFASDENGASSLRPRLVVDYSGGSAGSLPTGTANFYNEGQNFRWIYDLDNDKILDTPIAGRCSWTTPSGSSQFQMPYAYQFLGASSHSGLDCCTWEIQSKTGVTGCGQAIFYINLDGSNPANQPGDLDRDGIKDLCDNCPIVPNGPLLGTCVTGPTAGSPCRSNAQCGVGSCSLAQDDSNRNDGGTGDVCVPEPGVAEGLGWSFVVLGLLNRVNRSRHTKALLNRRGDAAGGSW